MYKKFINILALVTVVIFSACTKKQNEVLNLMMTPKEAAGMARNGFAVIVDVREADEIKEEGIAEGAVHIPIDEIESDSQQWKDFSKKIKPDQKVAFYCRSGGRAGRAASHAAKQGMSAANIGGLKDWIEAGLPVKKN